MVYCRLAQLGTNQAKHNSLIMYELSNYVQRFDKPPVFGVCLRLQKQAGPPVKNLLGQTTGLIVYIQLEIPFLVTGRGAVNSQLQGRQAILLGC